MAILVNTEICISIIAASQYLSTVNICVHPLQLQLHLLHFRSTLVVYKQNCKKLAYQPNIYEDDFVTLSLNALFFLQKEPEWAFVLCSHCYTVYIVVYFYMLCSQLIICIRYRICTGTNTALTCFTFPVTIASFSTLLHHFHTQTSWPF